MRFVSMFPPSSYLIRGEQRLRYRDATGRVDLSATQLAAKLLPHAPGLTDAQRGRLGRVVDRVIKATITYGELAAQGMLDERFGFPIILEVPIGGVRRGVGPDGPWERQLQGVGYGFLPDTVAVDDEPLDVIVGPDATAATVFILTQLDQAGMLDEHKLLIGFPSAAEAESRYLENWPPARYGGMSAMPIEVLRGLLNFEVGDAGAITKSIRVVAEGGVITVSSSGAVCGRIEPVRKRAVSHLQEEPAFKASVRLLPVDKSLDLTTPVQRRIVYGVVLEPEPFDGAGDAHEETYSAAVIERAAHDYLAFFSCLDDAHGRFFGKNEVVPVESFIAPTDFIVGGTAIKKGSWVLAARIPSDDVWSRVLRGDFKAWSIEGFAERECTTCATTMGKLQDPTGKLRWVCPVCDLGMPRMTPPPMS